MLRARPGILGWARMLVAGSLTWVVNCETVCPDVMTVVVIVFQEESSLFLSYQTRLPPTDRGYPNLISVVGLQV